MAAAKSLTPVELERVLQHIAANDNAERNRLMLLMTVAAGMRVGEVACLTISDVRDFDNSVRSEIYLAAHRVKHSHARTVYLNSRRLVLSSFLNSTTWYIRQICGERTLPM